MIQILVVSPWAKDANSFYRCMGPWSYLAKQSRKRGDVVQIRLAQDDIGNQGVAWDTVDQCDLVFMHRPCRDGDMTILKVAKNMNVPVWVDYDDWLFDVPLWNPTAGNYNAQATQNVVATMMAAADVVSVTTDALYQRVKLVNPNVVIIPNCYRSDIYPYRAAKPLARTPIFAWRGTRTHDADLLSVAEGFRDLPAKTLFYGDAPWALFAQMKPGSYQPIAMQDPFLYMKTLYVNAPKVLLFPLMDCFFNRVKSNIAYQEALHAGAICVGPDLPEWRRAGVLTYEPGNAESFAARAREAFALPADEHEAIVSQAYEAMIGQYGAPEINRIRQNTLDQVMRAGFRRSERDPFDPLLGMWAMGKIKEVSRPEALDSAKASA